MPQPKLAFLIADGARARLMLRHGDGHYSDVASFAHDAEPRRAHDTRGRVHASVGGARSALGEPDPEHGWGEFGADLAAAVEDSVAKGLFDRFALVAPPRMLAAIRHHLGVETSAKLTGELAKDLTKLPERDLREKLDALAMLPNA
jgi:protein required for attachment to host cells